MPFSSFNDASIKNKVVICDPYNLAVREKECVIYPVASAKKEEKKENPEKSPNAHTWWYSGRVVIALKCLY